MNKKLVLFIDDNDISEIIGKLQRRLQKEGITLIPSFLNLKEERFKKENPENKDETVLDFDAIKKELKLKYMNERFDLIACDFNLLDKNLNGFKLTEWLKNVAKSQKNKIRHGKFTLYSSEKEKSLNTFTEDDMSRLIRLKVEDFFDRTNLADGLATIIHNNENEIDLSLKLLQELDKYPDLKFKSVYTKFVGKSLKEIAAEIENETYHGIGFQTTLIELCVAHMINLNEE